MITEHSSVTSTLEKIICKVELELEQGEQIPKCTIKRKLDPVSVNNRLSKRAKYDSFNTEEILCRICYDSSQQLPIAYPCKCKGTMGAIHIECLEHWLEESNKNNCELCGHEFQVERTLRYKAMSSLIIWLCLSQQRHQLYVRNLRSDLLRCTILTPITIACSYICIVGADFYAMNNYDNFPPARWTTYSLLAMMVLLICSYSIWTYMAIQYHQKVWFYWWQKTSTVKIVLPSEDLINYKTTAVSQV